MVHEQANLVFTIPFNLRERSDNQDLAFPTPDDAVRDYLVTGSLSDDEHILKTNYLKFFASLFTEVNSELEKCLGELSEKQIRTAEELARWWSCHLEGIRTGLYEAAIDGVTKANQILPEIQNRHAELLAKRRSNTKDSDDTNHNVIELCHGRISKSCTWQTPLLAGQVGWDCWAPPYHQTHNLL